MKTAIQILDEMIEEQKNKPIAEYMGDPEYIAIPARKEVLNEAKERIKKETGWISVEDRNTK